MAKISEMRRNVCDLVEVRVLIGGLICTYRSEVEYVNRGAVRWEDVLAMWQVLF